RATRSQTPRVEPDRKPSEPPQFRTDGIGLTGSKPNLWAPPCGGGGGAVGRSLRELSQHVRKDPAVAVVVPLPRRVDAPDGAEGLLAAVAARAHAEHLARAQVGEALQIVELAAGQAERARVRAVGELERQDAHPDQVRAVDALEALGDHRAHAEEQ